MVRRMNNPIVSIVIPVYNVENYLIQCLDSVVSQTYEFLEIILVNDGSTDRSGEICNKYAENDKRIKVFHLDNSGSAEARNKGLDIATGKYVMFLDSDDYLEKDGIEKLLVLAETKALDMVCGRYKIVDEFGKILDISETNILLNKINNNIITGEKYLSNNGLVPAIWIYFYSKMYLDEIELRFKNFRDNGCYEDCDFVFRAIYFCKKIMKSDIVFYNYLQRKTSQKYRGEARLSYNIVEIADELIKFSENNVQDKECRIFFDKYIDFLYAQSVQRIIQLKCDANIFKKIDFKDKISQRLLKSQIKKYRIIGFCLKYNLMELYESIYSLYRKIFWNDFL